MERLSGIFQFESQGMTNFMKELKPDCLEDLIAGVSLYRPGPMGNIDSYIKRKQGKEKIEYIVPELEETLKPTYGIIIYQEQIMQIASIIAGYTLGEADVLRKAMSKKKEDILVLEKEIICMNTDSKQEGLMVKENKYQNLVLKQKKMHI